MRDEMLITGLNKADEVVAVYSHVDRMVTLGCMPVQMCIRDSEYQCLCGYRREFFAPREWAGLTVPVSYTHL